MRGANRAEKSLRETIEDRRENPESDAIWTCATTRVDGTSITYRDALDAFARTYWAEPREYELESDGATFQMVGGAGRVYRLECFPISHGWLFGVFVVSNRA